MNHEALSWLVPIGGIIVIAAFIGVLTIHLHSALSKGVVFRFSKRPLGESSFVSKKEDPFGYWYGIVWGCILTVVCAGVAITIFVQEILPKLTVSR